MSLARQTETPVPTEPMSFVAPQRAIDAIDVGAVVREATADGVVNPQIDVSPFGTHAGWVRVTCRAEMALRLVGVLREAAGQTMVDAAGEERLAALRHAAVAAYRAYEDLRGKPGVHPRRRSSLPG